MITSNVKFDMLAVVVLASSFAVSCDNQRSQARLDLSHPDSTAVIFVEAS